VRHQRQQEELQANDPDRKLCGPLCTCLQCREDMWAEEDAEGPWFFGVDEHELTPKG